MKKKNNIMNFIIAILVLLIILVIIFLFKDNETNNSNEPETPKYTFTLNGGDVRLKYKEQYTEPGFTCLDKDNNDLSKDVIIINNVNINNPGEYQVIYRYNDKVLTRKVIVEEPSSYELVINYTVDNEEITKDNVTITYTITGETFVKAQLPDGTITEKESDKFILDNNGTYKINAVNIKKEVFEKEIIISNIDRQAPTGTCKATINQDYTIINVDAKDNNKITKYEYIDGNKTLTTIEENIYKTPSKTSLNISVKVYDSVENVKEIKCTVDDNRYYEPIKPPSGENVIFKEETDTLKVYISKIGSYYLTRIWTKDAYTQLNKAPSPSYGSNLYKPVDLLNRAMQNNNLENKLIVGFNASGFYLRNTFDAASVNAYGAYDKTEVGTIVINNGKVVRNAYNKAVKQWYLTGITKDNKMVIFEDNVAKDQAAIEAKQKWSQTVINSGIRNTFNFAGPIIQDGKKVSSFSKSMPDTSNNTPKGLQLICQINENNYALFTSTNERRNTGINKFLSMGCKTATNLDGGGSVALFYKSKNSKEFTRVVGGGRALPAAGYFNE